jgi:septal ring factor EnvC (AmiA/AmiB activator)
MAQAWAGDHMNKQELAELLKKLQSELESGKAVAPELRASLAALDQDIRKVLEQPADTPGNASDDDSLNSRARALEAKFEAEHPYLASTLRNVMDTLGKMGI